jgi:acetyl-CoA acyltransferase 1
MMDSIPKAINPAVFQHDKAQECMIPMGNTSENVAAKFGITRETQDAFAAVSHNKAEAAQKAGLFDAEIVPVKTISVNKDGEETPVVIDKDDGIRSGMKPEALAKLKPAFDENGSTTAGNSSQVSDGAAAVLIASRAAAKKHGLPIIGTFKAFACVGCPPDIMGIGPAVAIPAVLAKAGKSVDDVDVYEINEAFASQASYSIGKLNIPADKVNPKGGAIALGHPLGCTGARQVATLLHELKRTGKKSGVISMCIGTGMGAAAYLEAE